MSNFEFTSDRILLKFSPDSGAESPVWTHRGEMVFLDALPISAEFQNRLGKWTAEYSQIEDSPEWYAEGRKLYEELKRCLPAVYEVVWQYG